MPGELLLDTGPLVSLLDRHQPAHRTCQRVFEGWPGHIATTEAVIAESCHLLSKASGGVVRCLEFVRTAGIMVIPQGPTAMERLVKLIKKYDDVPMDYADATLVTLAEDLGTAMVFTLDRKHFSVYRRHGRLPFEVVP